MASRKGGTDLPVSTPIRPRPLVLIRDAVDEPIRSLPKPGLRGSSTFRIERRNLTHELRPSSNPEEASLMSLSDRLTGDFVDPSPRRPSRGGSDVSVPLGEQRDGLACMLRDARHLWRKRSLQGPPLETSAPWRPVECCSDPRTSSPYPDRPPLPLPLDEPLDPPCPWQAAHARFSDATRLRITRLVGRRMGGGETFAPSLFLRGCSSSVPTA